MNFNLVLYTFYLVQLKYFILCKSRTLTEILKYYETLDKNDIRHHIVQRDLEHTTSYIKHIKFKSHGKLFHLNLLQSNETFGPGFEAVAVDGSGREYPVYVNRDEYYEGFVTENHDSHVLAHINDGILTATVNIHNDTFIIEPMWRHDNESLHDMLVYKTSDINWNLTHANSGTQFVSEPTMCGINVTQKEDPLIKPEKSKYYTHNPRKRRATNTQTSKNICSLILVGDYAFFTNMAKSIKSTAINYMLDVARRVNKIYKETYWSDNIGKGIGLQVTKVKIHIDPRGERYNIPKSSGPWDVDRLLTEFSRVNWEKYCLAHLFTYQDFSKGVIGLAYVASPNLYEVGGICTREYIERSSRIRYLNCGLSSNLNWGRKLLTVEADLVTAHEIGHNFGSNHDPSSCAPSSSNGGKYIMYATSVSGEKTNNKRFSSCSKSSIAGVLTRKKAICFKDRVGPFCGNSVVEKGEQCDAGIEGEDACCLNCRLKSRNFQCSDMNVPCCRNCKIAASSVTCRDRFVLECKDETKCNGRGTVCPNAPPLDNNLKCGFSEGNCKKGQCVPLCKQYNKISCICGAGGDACKICCKSTNSSSSTCEPLVVSGTTRTENDGIPCFLSDTSGQCVSGVCKKSKQNVEDEFSSLLKDFSFSKFARFMEANIVGTILVFSLMIWIPASCIVHYLDKKQDEEDEQMRDWLHPKNANLLKAAKLKMPFKSKDSGEARKVHTKFHISS